MIFRGDVAHRGVEHLRDYKHHRVHCYCDVVTTGGGTNRKKDETIPSKSPFPNFIADTSPGGMRRGMVRALLRL